MAVMGVINRYAELLPVTEKTPRITLGEGNTPLVHLNALSEMLEIELWAKLEGCNPSGSFKDRGMVMAFAKALEEGAKAFVCASTGNTSASAAAYAAAVGKPCYVLLPAGHVALGKLAQALMYGAHVIAVKGNFDKALELAREAADNCDDRTHAPPFLDQTSTRPSPAAADASPTASRSPSAERWMRSPSAAEPSATSCGALQSPPDRSRT